MQNERTRLAWQRTTLSGLACSLLIARLLAGSSLTLAVAVGLTAVVTSAAVGWLSTRRYAKNNVALHADRLTTGARSHLLVTALVTITALGALVYVA